MGYYKEGEKFKGPCYNCKKLVDATFKFADYKIKGLIIHDILQGFCDECGESISVPHQSSAAINRKREEYEKKNK